MGALSSNAQRWHTIARRSPTLPRIPTLLLQRLRSPIAALTLATLSAVALGLFVHAQAFLVFAGLAAIVLIGVCWPTLSILGLKARVRFPQERGVEGTPVPIEVRYRNLLPWTAWDLRLRLVPPPQSLSAESSIPLPPARGWKASDESSLTFTPSRRGLWSARPPRLASSFPFGLWTASRGTTAEGSLLVWPRRFPVTPLPESIPGRFGDGVALRNIAGSSGDVIGTRYYRAGDPIKRVHWSQTARHDTLIVRELQATASIHVQIVLDLDPRVHSGETTEWAVRVAASFAHDWTAAGALIHILAAGRMIGGPGAPAVRSRRLLDALAKVEPDPNYPLNTLLHHPAARSFRHGLRLIITTTARHSALDPVTPGVVTRRVLLAPPGFGGSPRDRLPVPAVTPWIFVSSPADLPAALLTPSSSQEGRHAG